MSDIPVKTAVTDDGKAPSNASLPLTVYQNLKTQHPQNISVSLPSDPSQSETLYTSQAIQTFNHTPINPKMKPVNHVHLAQTRPRLLPDTFSMHNIIYATR